MYKLLILLSAALLSACAAGGGYNPRYYFNEVQAVNLTDGTITDVSLRVNGSTKALACAEVNKFAMCADRFGNRLYPKQGIELSWTGVDGNRKTDTQDPRIPSYYPAAFPLRIVLEINADGSVKAFYEQDEPGRDGIYDMM